MGENPICEWSHVYMSPYIEYPSSLPWWYCHEVRAVVLFGPGATILPNDALRMSSSIVWVRDDLVSDLVSGSITAGPPDFYRQPEPQMTTEDRVTRIPCDPYRIDASGTTGLGGRPATYSYCLLYTSDAADE